MSQWSAVNYHDYKPLIYTPVKMLFKMFINMKCLHEVNTKKF